MAEPNFQLIDVLNNFVRVTNDIKRLSEDSEKHESSRKSLVKKFDGKDLSWEEATVLHDHYDKFLAVQKEIEDLIQKLEIAKNYLKLHLQAFGNLAVVFEYDHGDEKIKDKVFIRIFINKKGDIEFAKA